MARDKNTVRMMTENLKNEIKRFNEQTGASLSYSTISKKVNKIFKMDESRRDAAIKAYELELRKQVVDKVLNTRSTLWSVEKFVKNSENHPLMRSSITLVTKSTRLLLNGFCDLKQEGYVEAHPMTKDEAKAVRDWELSELKNRTLYSEAPLYMKAWDEECFRQEAESLDYHFRNKKTNTLKFTFKNRYGAMDDSRKDIVAADTYHKMSYLREQLAKHGFFWRLFHSKQVAMWRGYITKAEETLHEIGFVESEHKDKAIEMLKQTIATPHDMDEEVVKGEYEKAVNEVKKNQVEELTVARDLLSKNQKLDLNPETSITKKLDTLLEKHGLKQKFSEIMIHTNLAYAAEQYDRLRNIEEIKESAIMCLSRTFSSMIQNAILGEREINVSEFLADARTITATVMDHYMPVSEIEELKNINVPLYTFTFNEKAAMVPLNLYENGINIKDPRSLDGYRKVMPLPGTIEKAREDVKRIMNEWAADPQKLFEEDQAMLSQYKANVTEADKQPIVVDLAEATLVNDASAEKAPAVVTKEEINNRIAPKEIS